MLDTSRRTVSGAGGPRHLAPKAFELLVCLVRRWPEAVSRQELYDHLWPTTFVDGANLHTQVHDLREALGDDAREIICNVYGFGFRLGVAVDVLDRAPATRHQLVIGDRVFDLVDGDNLVGRDHDCAVRIDSPSVSRHHARITVADGTATLHDLGSKNGTSVRGLRARTAVTLASGDRIVFGTILAVVRMIAPAGTTESAV